MAKKAAKAVAKRNSEVLSRTHLIALAVHVFYVILRVVLFRASFTKGAALKYTLISAPSIAIEVLFEINSRPKWRDTELVRGGEDLEAGGLTEWMWDVIYWTWGCIAIAAVVGDWAWWLYLVVPVYSAWLAWTTFGGLYRGMRGEQPAEQDGASTASTSGSKRQAKMEKRGGQKVQYR